MFRIGQRIVCVNNALKHPLQRLAVPNWPVQNSVYTVRGVNRAGHIVLEEILNPPINCPSGFVEPHFHRTRFRPVIERRNEQGMEILNRIRDSGNVTDVPEEPKRKVKERAFLD